MKWFKHDADSNRDPKIEKLLMKYGADGYALYWLCLELIVSPIDKRNLTFELEHDAEILAHRLKIDSARVEEIMRYMVAVNLFELDATTERITCMTLAKRLEISIVKNPELKAIQEQLSRENRDSGAALPAPDDDRRDTGKSARKSKPKTAKRFNEFWEAYPRKKDKKRCLEIWKRRNLDDIADTITADVKHRSKHDPQWTKDGGKYIPHPSTYLNGDRWQDVAEVPTKRSDDLPSIADRQPW